MRNRDEMTEQPDKKVFIKTYGCQMNVYDSERMHEVLRSDGYVGTDTAEDADLVILNTCHIREKAAEKVYSELGRLRPYKRAREQDGGNMMIAVAGCVAQAEGEEIVRRAPAVDLVFGPQTYQNLPQLLKRRMSEGRPVIETEFPAEDKFDDLDRSLKRSPALAGRRVSAFLTVQEGCDKFCSFCVVPYTRGAEFSRPTGRIREEAERLVASGVREITLLGQNVNAYHGEAENEQTWSLGTLLADLSTLDGLERLRYTTSHPRDMDEDLIAQHASNPKVMPYLHLPVQAGSNRVLKAMNRRHTADDYLHIIERLRAVRPDMALSGDFIVGFPGETDADFDQTMDLVREVNYAQAYSFKYSPRPGTPAADRKDQVSAAVKSERLAALQGLLKRQQQRFNSACVGRRFDVLLEQPGRHEGQLVGRSPYLQPVHVAARTSRIGEMVTVEIEKAGANSLAGRII